MNLKVDFYFNKAKVWENEIRHLRAIVLNCDLVEELKWGCPCYTSEGRNVVLIHTFKEYCALLFFKGALLKDPKKKLIQQTENVQAARQFRFTHLGEITRQEKLITALINEAIEVERSGLKVPLKKTTQYSVPEEFQSRLDKNKSLKNAFEALTPGRQRGYLLFFGAAKQSSTREQRIDKCIPKIHKGLGLND